MDVPNNASFTLEPRLALSKMVTSSSFPSQGWIFELGGRPRATAGPLPQRGSWPPASSQLRLSLLARARLWRAGAVAQSMQGEKEKGWYGYIITRDGPHIPPHIQHILYITYIASTHHKYIASSFRRSGLA
jgi:hypothetical protein